MLTCAERVRRLAEGPPHRPSQFFLRVSVMTGGLQPNTLYGDCLDWMRRWDDGCVDLIYLDPPFNSKTYYNVLYAANGAGDAQYRAFNDTWHWDGDAADRLDLYGSAVGRRAHDAIMGLHRILGPSGMLAYLMYMAERLEECQRLLKPSGSIYLHCDPTASHGLKLVMDAIFGAANFGNEIIWHYKRWPAGHRHFQRMHDVILRYIGGKSATFHVQYQPYSKKRSVGERRWMMSGIFPICTHRRKSGWATRRRSH